MYARSLGVVDGVDCSLSDDSDPYKELWREILYYTQNEGLLRYCSDLLLQIFFVPLLYLSQPLNMSGQIGPTYSCLF